MIKQVYFIFFITFFFASCKDDDLISEPTVQTWMEVPSHFPEPVFYNSLNIPTSKGFNLGKRLFYDPILSKDSSISCGSCHQLEAAFADKGKALSFGVDGTLGLRNSPALFNVQWHQSYMHDGGVNHIELVALAPIENQLEMKETIKNVLTKINKTPRYKTEFQEVFGVTEFTDKYFLFAITQFLSSLISAESPYDQMRKGTYTFSESEQKGYVIFQKNCNSCHTEPIFTNSSFESNGRAEVTDEGRKLITLEIQDAFKYKVPSLRNLSYTAPYMHDGSFADLRSVIEHYSNGIKVDSTRILLPQSLQFNDAEKQDLQAFLKTLDDANFVKNKLFLP